MLDGADLDLRIGHDGGETSFYAYSASCRSSHQHYHHYLRQTHSHYSSSSLPRESLAGTISRTWPYSLGITYSALDSQDFCSLLQQEYGARGIYIFSVVSL